MGSTYYNKPGEQRPRPLKVILGSTEQAKVLIDATDIRVNSGNPVFFQRDYHPKERQKIRELQSELSLRRQSGEKHQTIKDGEIVTAPRPFLWRSAVPIRIGVSRPSKSEEANAASGINTEKEAFMSR